jgi:hypothetical protein
MRPRRRRILQSPPFLTPPPLATDNVTGQSWRRDGGGVPSASVQARWHDLAAVERFCGAVVVPEDNGGHRILVANFICRYCDRGLGPDLGLDGPAQLTK